MDNKMKIAVFDLDGTLVSSENTIAHAYAKFAQKYQIPMVDVRRIKENVGLFGSDFFLQLYDGAIPEALDSDNLEHYYTELQDLYHNMVLTQQGVLCFDGIKEQIAMLAEHGWQIALCTGKGRAGAEQDLIFNEIHSYFSVLKTASDGYPSKPYPQILDAAIAESGGEPKDAIMIGDTSYDIDMANNLGVRSLAVLWGHHDAQRLAQAGATTTIDDVSLLFTTLESMMNGK